VRFRSTSHTESLPRRWLFRVAVVVLATLGSLAVLFGVDYYLHSKFERTAGVNIWGYRGPVVGRKKPRERRIAIVGGSATFGYGVLWNEAFPAVLERKLRARVPAQTISVVNLGYHNDGAYSLQFTLHDYQYLDYDAVCVYDGYNDVMMEGQNASVFRRSSPVYRLTGYMPIFPLIFREKAGALLSGGDAGALYLINGKTVFHPSLARKAGADALQAAAAVGEALERQLSHVTPEPAHAVSGDRVTGCRAPWNSYCESIDAAVTLAVARNTRVLVVTQPYLLGYVGARHRVQQEEMAAMLTRRFEGRPDVRYLNLGSLIDLAERELSFDRMHLTARGNEMIAAALVEPILDLLALPATATR